MTQTTPKLEGATHTSGGWQAVGHDDRGNSAACLSSPEASLDFCKWRQSRGSENSKRGRVPPHEGVSASRLVSQQAKPAKPCDKGQSLSAGTAGVGVREGVSPRTGCVWGQFCNLTQGLNKPPGRLPFPNPFFLQNPQESLFFT